MTTSNRIWTEEHVLTLIRMRRRDRSVAEAARKLNRSPSACIRVLRERAPELVPPRRKRKRDLRAWSEEDIGLLIKLKKEGLSLPEIARKVGRTASACSRAWAKHSKDADMAGARQLMDLAVSNPWRLRPYERSALKNNVAAYCEDTDDLLANAVETVENIERQESARFSVGS